MVEIQTTCTKRCFKCGKLKDKTEFYKNKIRADGCSAECKECHLVRYKHYNSKQEYKIAQRKRTIRWRKENPEKALRNHLKKNFNLTLERWYEMQDEQNYGCKICGGVNFNKRNKRLSVDHCHETGKIRGLLCDPCNKGLGHFRDSPEMLRKAADYLEDNK